MATINFLFRSSRKSAPLTVRLLFRDKKGADFTLSAKSQYIVSAEYWKLHNKNSKDATIKNKKAPDNAPEILPIIDETKNFEESPIITTLPQVKKVIS